MRNATDDTGWHLDKKVPIALIFAMASQMAGGIWFASKLDARIERLEMSRIDQHDRDERQDRIGSEAFAIVRSDIKDIAQKLDRLIERQK